MKKVSYTVAVFGLKQSERQVLANLFKLHSRRAWTYRLIDGPALKTPASIHLVDLDDAAARTAWAALMQSHDVAPSAIFVTTSSPPQEDANARVFSRPIRMQHLIRELDRFVFDELGYVPPIADESIDQSVLKELDSIESDDTHQRFAALVVDDSPTIRTLMRCSLSNLGIKAELFETADDALGYAERGQFQIAFLDVVVPGKIDGYKLCKIIKANPATREIPVILLTGKNSPIDKVRGKMAGSNYYLTKPLEQGELERVISKYLHR